MSFTHRVGKTFHTKKIDDLISLVDEGYNMSTAKVTYNPLKGLRIQTKTNAIVLYLEEDDLEKLRNGQTLMNCKVDMGSS